MNEKSKSTGGIQVTISGDVSGQVAAGNNIQQSQTKVHQPVSQGELEELSQLLTQLRNKVGSEAPADKKDAALERVDELAQAVTEKKPDLSTMEYIRNWFVKNVPGVAGAVVSVVVHPIVGKLVEAAGDALTADFKKRFETS